MSHSEDERQRLYEKLIREKFERPLLIAAGVNLLQGLLLLLALYLVSRLLGN